MQPKIRLEDDDWEFLRLLGEVFLYLNLKQIEELFPDRTQRGLRRRVDQLEEARIVSCREPDEFFNEARLPLYHLGPVGEKLLDPESKHSRIQGRVQQARQIRNGALPHMLFANRIQMKFGIAERNYDDYELLSWIPQYAPVWGVLNRHGLSVQPDGYAHYRKSSRDFHVFVEADRGSYWGERERRRMEGYQRYAATNRFRNHFSGDYFRVLIITKNERRAKNLVRVTSAYPADLFWVSIREEFLRQPLFEAYWRRHSSDVRHSLDEPGGPVPEPPAPSRSSLKHAPG